MGCGCGKNANRPTGTPAKIPGIVRQNSTNVPPARSQALNVTPRNTTSVSGLAMNRQAVQNARQEAIKKSLGGN